jgi:hypothetical protein
VSLSNFLAELKRRNVYKVAVAYAVACWALSQGIAQVFPVFDIPNWAIPITSASLMARRTRLVIRGEAPAVEFRDIAIDVAASMQLSFYVLPIDP